VGVTHQGYYDRRYTEIKPVDPEHQKYVTLSLKSLLGRININGFYFQWENLYC
jgi:hypothetical protein